MRRLLLLPSSGGSSSSTSSAGCRLETGSTLPPAVSLQSRAAPGTAARLLRTPRRGRPRPLGGPPSASATRSSGRCTSCSRRPSWRSERLAGLRPFCVSWFCASLALTLVSLSARSVQVQRGVQVPAERAEGAVSAAALLGTADAEEAPQVHQDGRRQVAPAQPHGLPDRQPAVLLAGSHMTRRARPAHFKLLSRFSAIPETQYIKHRHTILLRLPQ